MTTANTKLNVLVACESSGTVRDAFRKLGHNAWSCDLLPCDANPAYHVQGDVLNLLQRDSSNMFCAVNQWDLMIAHPPCTYLCNSGVRWLYEWEATRPTGPGPVVMRPNGGRLSYRRRVITGVHLSPGPPVSAVEYQYRNETRWKAMRAAAKFFNLMIRADSMFGIEHVAVENPIMHSHARREVAGATRSEDLARPDQIIQPFQFGHPESKATCLWLSGLPKLLPTKIVPATNGSAMWKLAPSKDRWKLRSKTYQGIANAMACQWSEYLLNQ